VRVIPRDLPGRDRYTYEDWRVWDGESGVRQTGQVGFAHDLGGQDRMGLGSRVGAYSYTRVQSEREGFSKGNSPSPAAAGEGLGVRGWG
jgi:hypothetical protein